MIPITIPLMASPRLYDVNKPTIPNNIAIIQTGKRNQPRKGIKLKTNPRIAREIETIAAVFDRFSKIIWCFSTDITFTPYEIYYKYNQIKGF